MEQAMLITPQGKKIILPPYVYTAVLEILELYKPPPAMSKEELRTIIDATYGMLADGPSLTRALLESRREEREREDRHAPIKRKRTTAKTRLDA